MAEQEFGIERDIGQNHTTIRGPISNLAATFLFLSKKKEDLN